MKGDLRTAVVGIGATGSVLGAALLSRYGQTILVAPRSRLRKRLLEQGLVVTGPLAYRVAAPLVVPRIADLKPLAPDVVFLCTKTTNLADVAQETGEIFKPGMVIVSTHNGLGTEDVVAGVVGNASTFRMVLNYGASVKKPGEVETAFFNRPNYLGSVAPGSGAAGREIAGLLTGCGLDTEHVEDIKLYVWKKMVMKCTMASICVLTGRTIKEALDFPATREIADACFQEALSVAAAMGYDLGQEYLTQAIGYLEKVGVHKDSMCYDVDNRKPTELDFLGGKIVEYARLKGIAVPHYLVATNLVKAIEDAYLRG